MLSTARAYRYSSRARSARANLRSAPLAHFYASRMLTDDARHLLQMVTELALQILRLQPTATILLVAPSNSATDTLCLRLLHALGVEEGQGQRLSMLRLNDRELLRCQRPCASRLVPA